NGPFPVDCAPGCFQGATSHGWHCGTHYASSIGFERCDESPKARRIRAADALADAGVFPDAARYRDRDRHLSPAVLLGRDRQCEYASAVLVTHPIVARHGSDRLRVCHARPERMEPGIAFRVSLGSRDCGSDLSDRGLMDGPFPAQPASRARLTQLRRVPGQVTE